MASITLPTKCFVQEFTLNGVDLSKHVNTLQVFETVCKPYITASARVIDTNNVLNSMNIVGGEPVSITINSAKSTYSCQVHILSIKGNESNQSLRAQIYQIEMIGPEYFGDRANMVQQSFKGITGTDIIQKLHSQFMGGSVNIQVPSIGLFGKDNAYVISSSKPFKAINDVRKMLSFGQYQTGSTMYWRDSQGVHLAPLEHLFSTLQEQQVFFQEATWGKSIADIARSENAVIAAISSVPEQQHGRMGLQDLSSKGQAEKRVVDLLSHKNIFDIGIKTIQGGAAGGTPISQLVGRVLNSVAGGHGGEHNFYMVDSQKIPAESTRSTEREKLYKATVNNGPQWTIKVPIQSGLKCTVGKGIYAKLLPPIGDLTTPVFDPEQTGGRMLVIDICHEVHNDDKMMAGTTTMRAAKGGIDT